MGGLRRAALVGLVALASAGAGGCTLYLSDHPLSSAYPPYPPHRDGPPPPRPPAPTVSCGAGCLEARPTAPRCPNARPAPGRSRHNAVAVHVVRRGDTLYSISRRYFGGDASRWRSVYEANRDVLVSPDCLFPGQSLFIPTPAGSSLGPRAAGAAR